MYIFSRRVGYCTMALRTIVISIFCLGILSVTSATPPSLDYGLCSQVFSMNQYCTGQISSSTPDAITPPDSQPRVGKAGPRGPRGSPGIVDYAAIEEKIAEKYSELQRTAEEEFDRRERILNAELEGNSREIENLRTELDEKSEAIAEMNKKVELFSIPDCRAVSRENAKVWNTGASNREGGVFDIFSFGRIYEVYCDLATDGGGWTVFQRRLDGSVDFWRTWEEYAKGFGSKTGEFWLGLENIHQLTQNGAYELRVDLTDWDGRTAYAKYETFSISGRSDNYRLNVGKYSGNAGNSLQHEHNRRFSAKDKDVDDKASGSCSAERGGAWWYGDCAHSNLNGMYNDTSADYRGLVWHYWGNRARHSLKGTEMKFRRK